MINVISFVAAALALGYIFRGWHLNRRDHRQQRAEAQRILRELRRHKGAE